MTNISGAPPTSPSIQERLRSWHGQEGADSIIGLLDAAADHLDRLEEALDHLLNRADAPVPEGSNCVVCREARALLSPQGTEPLREETPCEKCGRTTEEGCLGCP